MAATFIHDSEPGSLSDMSQIKVLICYLLEQIGEPLRYDQLNAIFQHHKTINYFNFCQAAAALLQSNHLEQKKDRDGNLVLALTEQGAETAQTLRKVVPPAARDRSVQTAKKLLQEERENQGKHINIEKVEDGHCVHLTLSDMGSDLLNLKLFCPDEQQAKLLARRCKIKTVSLYQTILGVLLNEEAPLAAALQEVRQSNAWEAANEK